MNPPALTPSSAVNLTDNLTVQECATDSRQTSASTNNHVTPSSRYSLLLGWKQGTKHKIASRTEEVRQDALELWLITLLGREGVPNHGVRFGRGVTA